jgi:hypothetical protein
MPFTPVRSAPRAPGILLASLVVLAPGLAAAGLGAPRSRPFQDGPPLDVFGIAAANDQMGIALAAGDFDGDGRDDLAIGDREGSPWPESGAVHVLYSTAAGLGDDGDDFWTDVDLATGFGDREEGDRFGGALAAGDFNGDGVGDLAIGIPGEMVENFGGSGAVLVLYGQAGGGLAMLGAQRWRQGAGGLGGEWGPAYAFGAALAAGDFDDDGRDDLAIGAPGQWVGGFTGAGRAHVLYGSVAGLVAAGSQIFDRDSSGIADSPGTLDNLAFALAAGDFDADGAADLAIGVHGDDLPAGVDAGQVHVLYGGAGVGLTSTGSQLWSQSSAATLDPSEPTDRFGAALAAADLDGDGDDDLAIGAPGEDSGATTDVGSVTVLYGEPGSGLGTAGSETWLQAFLPFPETSEAGDAFGAALAAGDFDGDGRDDLAIGAEGDSAPRPAGGGTWNAAGIVAIVRGAAALGLFPATDLAYQGYLGTAGATGLGEYHGHALAAGDFDGDGHADLAIGAPGEDNANAATDAAGAAFVLYGSRFADGFETSTTALWSEVTP